MKYKRNGSVVVHHGYWFYSVKLPGAEKRRMLALRAPGAEYGLSADRPREMAEQAAARLWENACRDDRQRHGERGATAEAVCALNWGAIDETRTPWVYRPCRGANKNGWRGELGQPRVVLIGPCARAILERHRGSAFPFSPAQATVEWLAEKRAAAVSPARKSRADPHAVRHPGLRWRPDEYRGTVAAACKRAGIPAWSPNRLRHSFATDVLRAFGLEAYRAVRGHANGRGCVADRYSFAAIEDETISAATAAVEALG